MPSQLEEILSSIAGGRMTLDDACRALTQAARANPSGTQLWPMLIEARVTQNEITAAVGRALCEALENFEPEKTMWLAPAKQNAPVLSRVFAAAVFASVFGSAPFQCASKVDPNKRMEEEPGEALYGLAEKFKSEGNQAARVSTLKYIVKNYPSSRFAETARQDLSALADSK